MWAVQQIIVEQRPDVIIETGTWCGGSALFYACCMDGAGIDGMVVSIDITDYEDLGHKLPRHPKLTFITGDSAVDPGMDVSSRSVMVILDSDHHASHVTKELQCWAPYVSLGQYLIVEDTRCDQPEWMGTEAWTDGPGPSVALREWGIGAHGFMVDRAIQPQLTFHPGGYLRRVRRQRSLSH